MDGEGPPAEASRHEAAYWLGIYTEILAMEEKVLRRIEQLMATQSEASRHEVELTNVPVIVAQVERFRQRRGYWEARMSELDGHDPITRRHVVKQKTRSKTVAKTSRRR